MTPADLAESIVAAVRRAVASGALAVEVPRTATVERPKQREHGDYATNIALQLAKPAGRPPRDVAQAIKGELEQAPGIGEVDIAGPGFLNIRLAEGALGELARTVVTAGASYGRAATPVGTRVNLEFVSANPTGPMHVGHARWAAVGDALGRLFEAIGYDVTREFYVNDAGAQTGKLAESLLARARQTRGEQVDFPADGYHGDYIAETAAAIVADQPAVLEQSADEALEIFRREGLARLLGEIQATLAAFDVHFDVWFSEQSLHTSGEIEKAIALFRQQGRVYDEGGAVWLRTTDFGDDKDRVLVRSDGTTTYFAADCAYYLDKRERGADRVLIQVGADHHGYIGRMQAMVACYGDDPAVTFEMLIGQLVSLTKNGEPVRMSKRAGTFVAFDDLVDWAGKDAARYSLVRSSMDAAMELDLDLITRKDAENPVFYVQYAHARLSSLQRNAADLGIGMGDPSSVPVGLLGHERESDLIRALGEFPRVIAAAAELRQPHRVARYLEELAGTYHRFYDACRVLPRADAEPTDDDGALTRARLLLCEATRTVLANGLALLGVTAPDRM
ncbi:MAG TPA: arginine--tRNA ligase [Mycobacteriales bacterium]|nr:arginine--tRNA ligase [Mycobacteriales bacterium]